MQGKQIAWVLCLLGVLVPAAAARAEQLVVAIVPPEGQPKPGPEADALAAVGIAVQQTVQSFANANATVFAGESARQVVRESGIAPATCDSRACPIKGARKVRANRLILFDLHHEGGLFVSTMKVVDAHSGAVISNARAANISPAAMGKALETSAAKAISSMVPTAPPPAPPPPPVPAPPTATATPPPAAAPAVAAPGSTALPATATAQPAPAAPPPPPAKEAPAPVAKAPGIPEPVLAGERHLPPAKPHEGADVFEDFAWMSNPSADGSWRYGVSPTPGGPMELFDSVLQARGVEGWQNHKNYTPNISRNTTTKPATLDGITYPVAKVVVMRPGPKGELAVLRWVSFANKDYALTGAVSALGAVTAAKTNAMVLVNGQPVVDLVVAGKSKPQTFDKVLSLKRKDTVDFVVGLKDPSAGPGDVVGLEAIIKPLPTRPATANK